MNMNWRSECVVACPMSEAHVGFILYSVWMCECECACVSGWIEVITDHSAGGRVKVAVARSHKTFLPAIGFMHSHMSLAKQMCWTCVCGWVCDESETRDGWQMRNAKWGMRKWMRGETMTGGGERGRAVEVTDRYTDWWKNKHMRLTDRRTDRLTERERATGAKSAFSFR